METLGFKTFITKPCLNSLNKLLFGIFCLQEFNSTFDLCALKAKKSIKLQPNIFKIK